MKELFAAVYSAVYVQHRRGSKEERAAAHRHAIAEAEEAVEYVEGQRIADEATAAERASAPAPAPQVHTLTFETTHTSPLRLLWQCSCGLSGKAEVTTCDASVSEASKQKFVLGCHDRRLRAPG